MDVRKLGEQIRELRKMKGLSQKEIAEGICSESYLSQIERGSFTGMVSAEILSGICSKLGVSIQQLLGKIETVDFENEIFVDIVKVLIHREEYDYALDLIAQLQQRDDLLEYQREQILLNFADCLTKKGDSQKAIKLLSDFQNSLEVKQSTDHHILANVSNLLGNAYFHSNDVISAYSHYSRAYQLCSLNPVEDILSAKISYNLGNAAQSLRLDVQAKVYLENAVQIFERLGDKKSLAASLYWLGLTLKNLDQIDRAGEYIRNSLALYEAEKINKMVQIAKSLYAFHFIAPTDQKQAISELYESVQEYEKLGDISLWVFNKTRIAKLYLDNENISQAKEILDSILCKLPEVEQIVVVAYFHRIFSEYLAIIKEYDESLENSFKSAELCDKMGLAKEKANSLRQAVKTYQLQGKVEEALALSLEINEILYNALDFGVLT